VGGIEGAVPRQSCDPPDKNKASLKGVRLPSGRHSDWRERDGIVIIASGISNPLKWQGLRRKI